MQTVLVFVHMPKVGGVTLQAIIERQFPSAAIFDIDGASLDTVQASVNRLRRMAFDDREKIACVKGHVPYGIHQWLPRPSRYVTILRNPFERIVSDYYFARNTPGHILHERMHRDRLSLTDFIHLRDAQGLSDLYCRMLAGTVDWGRLADPHLPPGAVEAAKGNMERAFAVVGITERFDESLSLMQRAFGWGEVGYERANVTPDKPHEITLSAEETEAIRAHYGRDIELYAFAERLLEARVAAAREAGDGFADASSWRPTLGSARRLKALGEIEIRLARPGDEIGIAALFRTVFDKELPIEHWRWKYLGQDQTKVYSAIALHPDRGIVAHYGAVPHRMVFDEKAILGMTMTDVMVHPELRGTFVRGGFFRDVAARVIIEMAKDGYPFAYGFPTERHARLGEKLDLYVSLEDVFEARREVRCWNSPARVLLELFRLDFLDPRIDDLWTRVAPRLGLAVIRDRRYFDWRYRRHPAFSYELWGLRRRWSRRLEALAVIRDMGDALYVMDLVWAGSSRPLLEKLDNMAASVGKTSLTLWLPSRHHAYLQANGFVLRPAQITIPLSTHPDFVKREALAGKLFYTLGDTDYL